mmetsp:Transcript_22613/g.26225  ORF Transcript_22613/g.26225 Transcript_22613/m.26225 type:complete len:314 (-) Transcript_22613:777-1718(-)
MNGHLRMSGLPRRVWSNCHVPQLRNRPVRLHDGLHADRVSRGVVVEECAFVLFPVQRATVVRLECLLQPLAHIALRLDVRRVSAVVVGANETRVYFEEVRLQRVDGTRRLLRCAHRRRRRFRQVHRAVGAGGISCSEQVFERRCPRVSLRQWRRLVQHRKQLSSRGDNGRQFVFGIRSRLLVGRGPVKDVSFGQPRRHENRRNTDAQSVKEKPLIWVACFTVVGGGDVHRRRHMIIKPPVLIICHHEQCLIPLWRRTNRLVNVFGVPLAARHIVVGVLVVATETRRDIDARQRVNVRKIWQRSVPAVIKELTH